MSLFDLDKWQEIFETLAKNKLRVILTSLSVSWGIFMLIMLLGFGNGLQSGIQYNFRDDAVNSIFVRSGTTSKAYKGYQVGRRIDFKNADFNLVVDNVDGIEHAAARFNIGGTALVVYKEERSTFDVRCTHPDHKYIEETDMISGRFINDTDIKEKRKIAVLGSLVVKQLFPDIDKNKEGEKAVLGEWIKINGVPFRIVGTFFDKGREFEQRIIYLPISTAQQVFGGGEDINQIMLTTNTTDVEESKKIEAQINSLLTSKHQVDPTDTRAIRVNNNLERFKQFTDMFLYIKLFVWFVGIMTIIAGIVGVGNIMLITVKERTREIGIRKAIGATPNSIITMIMQEAILITVVSGYAGLLVGIGLLELINYAINNFGIDAGFFRNPEVDFSTAAIATLFLVVSGSIAGYIPAKKAAGVNPIKAIREE